MKRVLFAVAVLAGLACGGVKPPPTSPSAMCLPCTVPCTPESSCAQPKPKAVAAAPKPVPPPSPADAAKFDPAPGEYVGQQMVTLSTTTPGAVIHYTTDGSAPNESSPVYTAPIPVNADTTVNAIAIAPGAPASAVSTGAYTIKAPPPPPRVVVTKERLQLKDKIFFDTGKTTIKPESYGLLDEVATALKDNADVKHVVVEGHTDNTGNKAMNTKLSKGRAEAVRSYLVKKGIEPARLEAKGFGPTRPVADNKTAKGREENRRVEFVIPQS